MTQEDKEILLKDICARLPYGIKGKYYDCCEGNYDEGIICGFERQVWLHIDGKCIYVEEVKPYLFPLSSMTEEENNEFQQLDTECDKMPTFKYVSIEHYRIFDWLNAHHFDYKGLIPKGLAIDATGLSIYE